MRHGRPDLPYGMARDKGGCRVSLRQSLRTKIIPTGNNDNNASISTTENQHILHAVATRQSHVAVDQVELDNGGLVEASGFRWSLTSFMAMSTPSTFIVV